VLLVNVFDQRGELPILPFGNPIGFVPASRGGVYIESTVQVTKESTRKQLSRFIGMAAPVFSPSQ